MRTKLYIFKRVRLFCTSTVAQSIVIPFVAQVGLAKKLYQEEFALGAHDPWILCLARILKQRWEVRAGAGN